MMKSKQLFFSLCCVLIGCAAIFLQNIRYSNFQLSWVSNVLQVATGISTIIIVFPRKVELQDEYYLKGKLEEIMVNQKMS